MEESLAGKAQCSSQGVITSVPAIPKTGRPWEMSHREEGRIWEQRGHEFRESPSQGVVRPSWICAGY